MTATGLAAARSAPTPGAPLPRPPAPRAVRPRPSAPLAPNATLLEREDLTPSIARLVIQPHDPVPPFVPGQYFALGLPVDGRWLLRPYSTASVPPVPGGLEFLIRLVPDGELTPRLWRLRPGDELRVGPPKGIFTLAGDDTRTHLLVATGTGLAPFVSMAAALRQRREPPRTVVVHGVAESAELAYRPMLEGWSREAAGFEYVPAVSRPALPVNAGWRGRTGRLDAVVRDLAAATAFEPRDAVAYLCGNPAMIGVVAATLQALGVPDGAIVREHYWTAPAPLG